jgi:hypothetical protein
MVRLFSAWLIGKALHNRLPIVSVRDGVYVRVHGEYTQSMGEYGRFRSKNSAQIRRRKQPKTEE